MEWEDLYDEYGYGDDPDGVLGEPRSLVGGGFADSWDEDSPAAIPDMPGGDWSHERA